MLLMLLSGVACGEDEPVDRGSESTASNDDTSSVSATGSTTTSEPTSTTKPRRQLPGPPSPQTPINSDIQEWHALLAEMTRTSCGALVGATSADDDFEHDLDKAMTRLYQGAGEGCLGQLEAARQHLDEARSLLASMEEKYRAKATPHCRLEELLSWAYFTYIGSDITVLCLPLPTSTSSSSSTSSTTSTSTPSD